jgi:hypothetical protein
LTGNLNEHPIHTEYFTSDNEPGGIENATRSTFATLTKFKITVNKLKVEYLCKKRCSDLFCIQRRIII